MLYKNRFDEFVNYVNDKILLYKIQGNIDIESIFIICTSEYSFNYKNCEDNIELLRLQLTLMEFIEKRNPVKFSNIYGPKISANIYNFDFIENLLQFIDNYSKKFIYKKQYDLLKIVPPKETVFTRQDITTLIDFQEDLLKNYLTDKKDFQKRFDLLISTLQDSDTLSKSVKTIRSNDASFLYDILSYFAFVPSSETLNSQEKYQFIKRYI